MRPIRRQWKSTPGNFDPNHLRDPLPSSNDLGMPDIAGVTEVPEFAWARNFDEMRTIVKRQRVLPEGDGLVHFFTEDYRFEQLWTTPGKFPGYMPPEHWCLTPDFSVYTDHPRPVHIWNIFRARWLGAHWQRAGLRVIPTVTWAGRDSYDYCFEGLPEDSVLAVSTVGVLRDTAATALWTRGMAEMQKRLRPRHAICYGQLPADFSMTAPHQILRPFYERFTSQGSAGRSRPPRQRVRVK